MINKMEAAGDRKKTLPSLICNLIMGGVLMGFFGKYYWGNPDVEYTTSVNPYIPGS